MPDDPQRQSVHIFFVNDDPVSAHPSRQGALNALRKHEANLRKMKMLIPIYNIQQCPFVEEQR